MFFTIAPIAISFTALVLSIFSFCYTYHESHIETRIDIQWLYVAKGRTYVNFFMTNRSSKRSKIVKITCKAPYCANDKEQLIIPARSARLCTLTFDAELPNDELIFSFDLNNEHRIMHFANIPKLTANEFVVTQHSGLFSHFV